MAAPVVEEEVVNVPKVFKSHSFVVNSGCQVPACYNFRRHFTRDGRYFYRLHAESVPSFSRTDTLNGDFMLYTPTEDNEHRGIQQLHYYKAINDDYGVLVFLHRKAYSATHFSSPPCLYIGLVKVCHKSGKYTLLDKARFRCFSAEKISQATLIRNRLNPEQMMISFVEINEDAHPDQSYFTFFEVRKERIRITKDVYLPTAVYFATWHGDYVDGLFEDEEEGHRHHLQRYDLRTDKLYTLQDSFLSVLNESDFVNDFCWYQHDLYMFVLTSNDTKVYIQKYNTLYNKYTRIDFPIDELAHINRSSRFFINTEGIVCYSETTQMDDQYLIDRFLRIPMKCPDRLLTRSWLNTRESHELEKKSMRLPFTFSLRSPVRELLKFESKSEEEIEAVKEPEDSGLGDSIDCSQDAESLEELIELFAKCLPSFTNDFFSDE